MAFIQDGAIESLVTSSLNSESPTRLVASELLKLKLSCCDFLDPERPRLRLGSPFRCLGALWHRARATDEAVSAMYRGLPPPAMSRHGEARPPFAGEPR
ncbi:hypothetical protein EJB05_36760 [Eragrostis curvula]|uniref:Uncharacterized protein n=1 Tax=Eragrostis curvula TaxID=38414 RepID=A0A5J9UB20_9POAL|nr:hypothetical protein EJB05_36760 [Eragrostis curvula]